MERNPEPVLRSRGAEPPWAGLAGSPRDSQLSSVVFPPSSGTSAKDIPHTMASFVALASFSFLPGRAPALFVSEEANRAHRCWGAGALSEKLTRDILEWWPRQEKPAPQQTTQKSFLWQTLLCFPVQQEGLKSTVMSQHRQGRTKGGKLFPWHQSQSRNSREVLPPG